MLIVISWFQEQADLVLHCFTDRVRIFLHRQSVQFSRGFYFSETSLMRMHSLVNIKPSRNG